MKTILTITAVLILILSSTSVYAASVNKINENNQKFMSCEDNKDFVVSSSDWLIMIYLDGDNNVEGMNIDLQFAEFADVGSTDDVKIVVQFDRIPGYSSQYGDWATTKRFYIEKNIVPTSENALEDLGELNMGDSQTVVDFAKWAMNDYPANNYCLIFCGNGYGWKGGICPDTTDNDVLEILEISSALNEITDNGANTIDLIGFDGCKMQMIEIGYEISKYAHYLTASEASEIWGGWKYYPALSELVRDPSISPESLGELFIEAFIEVGGKTLSTIDLEKLNDLKDDIGGFTSILQIDEYRQDIKDSILEAENYYENDYMFSKNYIDLYHFIQLLSNKINNNEVSSYAQLVISSIENAIISSDHDEFYQNSHGISIYMPYSGYDQSYNELLFSKNSLWDDFLRWYYYANPPNIPVIKGPLNGKIGKEYTFSASTNDIDSNQIYYKFDWGDGNNSGWLGPANTGEELETTYSWIKKGVYEVKVKAKDENGLESYWSDPLVLDMPKSHDFILNGFSELKLISRHWFIESFWVNLIKNLKIFNPFDWH